MVPGKPGLRGEENSQGKEARYREIMRSRSDPSTFYALLGMRLEELGEGRSRFVVSAYPGLFNAGGVVHGGVLASVADASIAAALATLIDPEREMMATVEMKINYIAPVRDGDIVGEGRVIQRGKTLAVGESSIYDGAGKLLAKAMATFVVKERGF